MPWFSIFSHYILFMSISNTKNPLTRSNRRLWLLFFNKLSHGTMCNVLSTSSALLLHVDSPPSSSLCWQIWLFTRYKIKSLYPMSVAVLVGKWAETKDDYMESCDDKQEMCVCGWLYTVHSTNCERFLESCMILSERTGLSFLSINICSLFPFCV